MQTPDIVPAKEATPVYPWLPIAYLLLFGGTLLLCLWAEAGRQ